MNRIILATLFATVALPAAAQTTGNGLSFGGEVKLEYLDANPRIWAFYGDVGANWRSGGLLGFDTSIETTRLDDGTDLSNYWAALVLSTGAGEFALGAPRPLVDSLNVMPKFSSSRVVDLETSFFTGSMTSLFSMQDNGATPGVTYSNTAGSLTYGGGYHHLNDGDNIDIIEGVMQYKSGAMSLFIAGEYANAEGPNLSLLQIGGLYDAERFDLGLALSQLHSSDTIHSLRLHGSVDVMDALALRADALLIQDSSDIYSLSATYSLPNGLFVEGGGTKIQNGNEVLDFGVGFKF
ncbi:MAG: hypothetical protein ACK4IU_05245 [Tabrizicola flagellatus]|uniref:hypothetical protein n=1 Tax=Tabrizicola flagellatus TaxID=2593021 RepID=UPI00391AC11C